MLGHLRFALPGLNALFLHGQRSGHLQRGKQHTLVESNLPAADTPEATVS